jgi:hypothetical protein
MAECVICVKPCGKNPHHIITRGAYGGVGGPDGFDHYDNRVWLCREHHSQVHSMGRETFFKRWLMEDVLERAKEAKRVHDGRGCV